MTEDQLRAIMRDKLSARGAQRAFAQQHGVSEQYLSDWLKGRRDAGPAIASACGYERVVTYRRVQP
jgi:DNA-binding transcriptional regulator YdaS (Cro superfamily)